MKIRTLLLAMVVGIPFFSCTDSEDIPQQQAGNTYLRLAVQLPASAGTKASSGNSLPNDYNDAGVYEGNDLIKTLDVYIINPWCI